MSIEIIISVTALIISIIAVYFSKTNNSTQMGLLEVEINRLINDTREKLMDITIIMAPYLAKENRSKEENEILKTFHVLFQTAKENNLNAYEEACAKYLDKKIDRDRFKRNYKNSIRQLVQDPVYKEQFASELQTKFKCIAKVYKEWENLEK